jgi:hypothetical protein
MGWTSARKASFLLHCGHAVWVDVVGNAEINLLRLGHIALPGIENGAMNLPKGLVLGLYKRI